MDSVSHVTVLRAVIVSTDVLCIQHLHVPIAILVQLALPLHHPQRRHRRHALRVHHHHAPPIVTNRVRRAALVPITSVRALGNVVIPAAALLTMEVGAQRITQGRP